MKRFLALLLIVSMALHVGCKHEITKHKTEFTVVTVSVAASLVDCMAEMERAFVESSPQIILQFNYGSSGALAQQIEQGAPVDIFFSAGMQQMQALKDKGLMEESSITEMLKNRLALVVPVESEKEVTFSTLAESKIKNIAVGDRESVPAGQYTMQVLEQLKLIGKLREHLVYAKNVREVLAWVETGNVDAGIVYETDAKLSRKVKITDLANEELHSPIIYPVGIVADTKVKEGARAFMTFLRSNTARAIFEKYGFTPIF